MWGVTYTVPIIATVMACGRIGFDPQTGSGTGLPDAPSGPSAGDVESVAGFGDPGSVVDPVGVTVDRDGNVYIVGRFDGTLTFAGTTVTDVNRDDTVVCAFDAAGGERWLYRFDDASSPGGIIVLGQPGIAVDDTGVVVTGEFSGTVDFGGGPVTSGGADVFVVGLTSGGQFRWAERIGGMGGVTAGELVIANGQTTSAGDFAGTAQFGTQTRTSAGVDDIYFARYDATGAFVGVSQYGGVNSDSARDVGIDASGRIYVVGSFVTQTDLGLGTLTAAGGYDAFVARYAADGSPEMATRFGGSQFDTAFGVALGSAGEIVVVGWFSATADFGSGPVTEAGAGDMFVASLEPNGNTRWAKTYGGTSFDIAMAAAIDTYGNVYLTGSFQATVDFGDGPRTSAGARDIVVLALDSTGGLRWARTYGGPFDDEGTDLAIDATGAVVLTGSIGSAVDFDGTLVGEAGTGSGIVVRLR